MSNTANKRGGCNPSLEVNNQVNIHQLFNNQNLELHLKMSADIMPHIHAVYSVFYMVCT